jgi:hypothetical protein
MILKKLYILTNVSNIISYSVHTYIDIDQLFFMNANLL